jgi:hypothetical protein
MAATAGMPESVLSGRVVGQSRPPERIRLHDEDYKRYGFDDRGICRNEMAHDIMAVDFGELSEGCDTPHISATINSREDLAAILVRFSLDPDRLAYLCLSGCFSTPPYVGG